MSHLLRSRSASKERLMRAIEESSSIKECLEYLGLRPAGGNYQQFYKWCEYHHLTPPKGDSAVGLRRASKLKQIPLDEILVRNSKYNRTNLKLRLLNDGLLENRCYECGQLPEWNGCRLTLQLDHINGVADDNRLSNLRLLCPNCHSQTANFAGKKRRTTPKYDICQGCLKKLGKLNKQPLCKQCFAQQPRLSRRKVERPTLNVLRMQVEKLGYAATGREYGVSDNAIRKWLKTTGM
jgi:transposase-like protein